MNSLAITIATPLSPDELKLKLSEITVPDFDNIRNAPYAKYYGDIHAHSFDIRHLRYGPLSHAPNIIGEVIEGTNKQTTVKVNMNIREPFELVRKMYYGTLLPIGVIVMLLSLLVMGGTDFQWQSLLLSSSFIVIAFLVVTLEKAALINTKKKELRLLVGLIEGKIVSDNVE